MRKKFRYIGVFWLFIIIVLGHGIYAQEIPPNGGKEEVTELFIGLKEFRAKNQSPELQYDVRLAEIASHYAEMVEVNGPAQIDQSGFSEKVRNTGYGSTVVQMVITGGTATIPKFLELWSGNELGIVLKDAKFRDVGIAYIDGRPFQQSKPQLKFPKDLFIIVLGAPSVAATGNWEQKIIELVNQFRAENNLPPLKINPTLSKAAQYQADDMALRDYFSHFSPERRDVSHRVTRQGYKWQKVSENLAAGQSTPAGVVDGWKKSKDGHREAMIDPNVNEAGVGYRYIVADNGRARFSHYWALVMAKPLQ